jgi:hypothetical protein
MRRLTMMVIVVTTTIGVMAAPASAFRDRDCADFSTHRQAQKFFRKHNPRQDPHGPDADHDGIACESLSCWAPSAPR